MEAPHNIDIDIQTCYLDNQSDPKDNRYTFAYTVTIRNRGSEAVTLLDRHWIITDANEKTQEVQGKGVVGEQPTIEADDSYSYTSGAMLTTSTGTMHGSYAMRSESGEHFQAPIKLFSLVYPGALH